MALTIEQEQALLAQLNEKKITLSELAAATDLAEDDLLLIRQGIIDKSVNSNVLKKYFTPPVSSLTESGIVKLSNAINSDDEYIAATSKAVKAVNKTANNALTQAQSAAELASSKVSSVNGSTGEVSLSAPDVDALPIVGGTCTGPITAAYSGPLAFVAQYDSGATFYNDIIRQPASEFHPLLKQRMHVPGFSACSYTFGTLISPNGTQDFRLYIRDLAGADKAFSFSVSGEFSAPGYVIARNVQATDHVYAGRGASYLRNDGMIYGSVWGGYLSDWIGRYFVKAIRRGSQQYARPADWTVTYEVPDGYISGFNNSTKDGNIRFSGWYFRVPMYLINGSWVNAVNS
ncbi:Phage tail fibre repeat [Pragia fontium]|uniref:tail fiber protein n=1 Tax=Pragia fontium TaxID=82985 RepID=UPI000E0362BE|nr:phage tail protein [Pragia fontium]SUB81754.1 Phage tail fibre repeat [Pragia fontium]SUC81312.1 Phage tail fibre repeat [Pragia fontium]